MPAGSSRRRLPVAALAILLALLLLAPTVETLAVGVERLAGDLASGRFSPFANENERSLEEVFEGQVLGGFTGSSDGNYVPGASGVPAAWSMDRNGFAGSVTIDYVCQPALGAMKRLKAYDTVGSAPDYELTVADEGLRRAGPRPGVLYDSTFRCSFPVELRPSAPTPIFSPGPDAIVDAYSTSPRVPGGVSFVKDGADTFHADAGDYRGRVLLNVTFRAPSAYYRLPPLAGQSFAAIPAAERPHLDEATVERAALVLARAGLSPDEARTGDVALVVRRLAQYFNAFGEGEIPGADVYDDLYLALGLGEVGCCRHRAFAFTVTVQALGVPARVVVNEAHAFSEVRLPDGSWRQVNLGGCGRYTVRNPEGYVPFSALAGAPRAPPQPENDVPLVPVEVALTSVPDPFEKGATVRVEGTVRTADGLDEPVRGLRVDLTLNATGDTAEETIDDILSGRPRARVAPKVVGTGTTDASGAFGIDLKVPASLAPGTYVLRAYGVGRRDVDRAFQSAYSDPVEVRVFARTTLALDAPATEGRGAPFVARATVLDAAGAPVVGVPVELTIDGERTLDSRTDARGRARFRLALNDTGRHALEASFGGTDTLGASRASRAIEVTRDAIAVDPEIVVNRGDSWLLEGMLLSDGAPVAGETIVARPSGWPLVREDTGETALAITLTTDAEGRFAIGVRVPAAASVGALPLALESVDRGLRKVATVTVLARPVLVLAAPPVAYGDLAAEWRAVVTLTDDAGAPIANAPVAVAFAPATGERPILVSVRTNSTGAASSALPLGSDLPEGSYLVRATFGGSDALAGATTSVNLTMRAGSPPGPGVGRALAAGALVLAVAAAAGASWAARRRGLTLRGGVARALVATGLRSRARVKLAFPAIVAPLPDAWTPGEPLLARATLERERRDGREPVADAEIVIELLRDGRVLATERARTDAAGTATALLPFPPEEGSLLVRARSRGGRRALSAQALRPVRAADYRREVEREHRAFVAHAARLGARVSAASSPREVEAELARWAPLASAGDLDAVASTFEALVFTEQPVSRREFAAFVLALRRAQAQFPVAASLDAARGGGAAVA